MIQILTRKNPSKDFHTSKNTSLFNIKGGPLPPQNQFSTSSGDHLHTPNHHHSHSNTSITQQKKARKVKNLHLFSRK
jgi:hypothetical protein